MTRNRAAADGVPLNPVRDRHLMYVGGEIGCTDYPTPAGR